MYNINYLELSSKTIVIIFLKQIFKNDFKLIPIKMLYNVILYIIIQ